MEKHFERPEVTNVEIAIFLNRLIGVFGMLMSKLEFAATLPQIIADQEIFKMLKKQDAKQVLHVFAPYTNSRETSEILTISQSLDTVSGKVSESTRLSTIDEKNCICSYKSFESVGSLKEDINIFGAIEILHSYPSIRQLSKECKDNIPKSTLNFLRQIKYFMEFAISKTQLMPAEERKKELHLRHVCSEIDQCKHEISELTDSLEEQKLRHQKESADLSDQIDVALETWENINREFNNRYAQIIKDSEDESAKLIANFIERMNDHQQTFDKLKMQVEREKKDNRQKENDVQGKKIKVESQLSSLIMKFDSEVTARQESFDELMEEFKALEQERTQLMEEMEEQLNIYDRIMREKEEKEFEAYREKYEKFVNHRCAKIIQRWWRKVFGNKKKKKKGKKKKAKPS